MPDLITITDEQFDEFTNITKKHCAKQAKATTSIYKSRGCIIKIKKIRRDNSAS